MRNYRKKIQAMLRFHAAPFVHFTLAGGPRQAVALP